MNKEDLAEYLEKIIKPALEQYAKEKNITLEDILKELTTKNLDNKEKHPSKKH